MSKHTPGPWHQNGMNIYGPKHPESKHGNGRIFIAEVAQGSRRAVPELHGGAERFGFDAKADVRLMTTAPELLGACQAALAAMEADYSGQFADAAQTLRDAISKAGGEV